MYAFWRICSRELFKTLWQKKKFATNEPFAFYQLFSTIILSIQQLYSHLQIYIPYISKDVLKSHLLLIYRLWERFNPFPHTTILQQTTLNIFCQKIQNLYNWMDNLWWKTENIVAKWEIARFEQFLLLSLFSKSCLL